MDWINISVDIEFYLASKYAVKTERMIESLCPDNIRAYATVFYLLLLMAKLEIDL